MQRDAIERLDLQRLLLEPEMLEAIEPDVHLVATLLALQHLLPDTTRATARQVVGKVVAQIQQRLGQPTMQAVSGALARTARAPVGRGRPTSTGTARVRANLAQLPAVAAARSIPERLVGYTRLGTGVRRELIIAIDQSASMGDSVVYASVFGAALASIRSLQHAPRRVRHGGRRPHRGAAPIRSTCCSACSSAAAPISPARWRTASRSSTRPDDTVLVLISDLYEGTPGGDYIARIGAMARSGVRCVALLALSDEGAPAFDHAAAQALGRARRAGVRLHAPGVPRSDRRRDRAPRPHPLGGRARLRRHRVCARHGVATRRP